MVDPTVIGPEIPTLEPCGPGHAEVLAGLHARCFGEPWNATAMRDLLVSPGAYGFLAVKGKSPVGLILCRVGADECEILTLAVLDAIRRNGIGAVLLDAALNGAAARNVRRMFLEVGARNQAARSLYISRGFRPIGRRRNYYRVPGEPSEDALVLCVQMDEIGPAPGDSLT